MKKKKIDEKLIVKGLILANVYLTGVNTSSGSLS